VEEIMGKNIIITGATGNLGQVIVDFILKQTDWNCIIPYRSPEKFNNLKDLWKDSNRLLGYEVNMTDEKSVSDFYTTVLQKLTEIHGLVHTAGGFWMGKELADTSLQELHKMMEMNFLTSFLMGKTAFHYMRKTGGKLIFIGARPALDFVPMMGAYAISKSAMRALAMQLANEGAGYGISTALIIPGIIDTPTNREAMPEADFSTWTRRESIAESVLQILKSENVDTNYTEIRMFGRM
jgi:NAD(P)-dependent dehydrogenase (short-subunit alcohol dehydrogenase family)